MENPLEKYFKENNDRIIQKWMHYFDIYHRHFKKFQKKECVILEIGVSGGGSLQMWRHYFGENAQIYAIDIDPNCKQFEDESTKIFIGSQADREFLRKIRSQIPKIDILIDDGGHRMNEQKITFEEIYDHIKEDGVYLCEDTHTSYWKEYGGGYKNKNSFIEYTKDLIDHLSAWHIRSKELGPSKITQSAHSFHYYDSVFVIEKRKRIRPWDEMRGSCPHNIEAKIGENNYQLFLKKLHLLGVEFPENLIPEFIYLKPFEIKRIYIEKYNRSNKFGNREVINGYKKLTDLEFCVKQILKNGVNGDFVATDKSNMVEIFFMLLMIDQYNDMSKTIWLIDLLAEDSIQNDDLNTDDMGRKLHRENASKTEFDILTNKLDDFDVTEYRLKKLEVPSQETFASKFSKEISIAWLGDDQYKSLFKSLYNLYSKISIGGYIIIDNWDGKPACKKAVQEFRKTFKIKETLIETDWSGVYWKKTKEIKHISFDTIHSETIDSNSGLLKKLIQKFFYR